MSNNTTVVIERCRVSPPKGKGDAADNEFSLPMSFFDMLWYTFPVSQVVFFFEIPNCSRSHFLETIVPSLKHSLSLTIKHFLPLSGHIVHPLNPVNRSPVLRYRPGDSISFTVAESKRADGYSRLIGKQPRASDDFYPLVTELPSETETDDSVMFPVIALQVTLLQGFGISIGSVTHHAALDAVTTEMFYKAWAWMTRSWESLNHHSNDDDDDEARRGSCTLPCYDRATTADINGLGSFYWGLLKSCRPVPEPHVALPTNKWRATFVLKREQVKKLKDHVMARCPDLQTMQLSSFAVTTGLVWTCSSRAEYESSKEEEEEEEDKELEVLGFVADCRERLNPKLPGNYFGNCLAFAKADLSHGDVVGVNGFVLAVEAIAKAVRDRVYAEKGILTNARDWDVEFGKDLQGKRVYGVAGFPRFDIYNVDFGWGNPKKFEPLFIDNDRSIFLCKSVEFEGGIEIGISRTKSQMDAFVRLFHGALQEFTCLSNL